MENAVIKGTIFSPKSLSWMQWKMLVRKLTSVFSTGWLRIQAYKHLHDGREGWFDSEDQQPKPLRSKLYFLHSYTRLYREGVNYFPRRPFQSYRTFCCLVYTCHMDIPRSDRQFGSSFIRTLDNKSFILISDVSRELRDLDLGLVHTCLVLMKFCAGVHKMEVSSRSQCNPLTTRSQKLSLNDELGIPAL